MKKIEKKIFSGEYVKLENQGDYVEGVLIEKSKMETQFGEREYLKFVDDEGQEKIMFISAGLQFFDWESLMKRKLRIVYVGMKKNEKSKRYYKDYEVYDLSDEEDIENVLNNFEEDKKN